MPEVCLLLSSLFFHSHNRFSFSLSSLFFHSHRRLSSSIYTLTHSFQSAAIASLSTMPYLPEKYLRILRKYGYESFEEMKRDADKRHVEWARVLAAREDELFNTVLKGKRNQVGHFTAFRPSPARLTIVRLPLSRTRNLHLTKPKRPLRTTIGNSESPSVRIRIGCFLVTMVSILYLSKIFLD